MAGACVYIGFGRPGHASISGSDGRGMRLYRVRMAEACVYIGFGWPKHASISGSDGRGMRLYRDRTACQETPTFTHLGDTYFCAPGMLVGGVASRFPRGSSLGPRVVSVRGAGPRRERSDRSGAAPRTETSAGAGRRVRCRVAPGISRSPMHPCHASPGVGRSSAAGTRRRSPSSFRR